MRRWIAIAVLVNAASAAAEPAGESRCQRGAEYARRNDLPRAALYLAGCEDLGGPIAQAAHALKRRLDQSPLAKLEILSRPEGLAAEIDALPDETLTTPATVWVAAGPHTIRVHAGATVVERTISAKSRKDELVMIETQLDARPAPPRTQTIEIGSDETSGSLGEEHTAPPPDIKHPSMIQGKYAGVPDPAAEGPIDDPLASHRASSAFATHAASSAWLGIRLGAGLFDDTTSDARAGLAVAVAARLPVSPRWFVAGRADWSRRGGAALHSDAIDVLGASAGLGATLFTTRSGLALAVLAQLRGELRLASSRDDLAVPRAGLGLAGGAELALPGTPITTGIRVEQGVTHLVDGARDRAVLFELGLELR